MKKLVAYITTAYPDKNFTIDLASSLALGGVDMLELGIAFSDPVADGPTIERANGYALKNGFRFSDVFDVSKAISSKIDTLWMGYFNSFYQKGIENIIQKAKSLGVDGFIIPDLPYEESSSYKELFDTYNLANITFVAPTDTKERISLLVEDAKKFIYLVAYAGITGTKNSEDLSGVIADIRDSSSCDIYVGFGVNATTAKQKALGVDGVIVGSAFIDILLKDDLSYTKKIQECVDLAKLIKSEINL